MGNRKRGKLPLFIIGLILIGCAAILFAYNQQHSGSFGEVKESVLVQIPIDELPEDTLYITPDRKLYQRGDMRLLIPSLELDVPIAEDTTEECLMEMPGLYEFAQLPSVGDVNVSIAGHRDIYGKEFYYLDKLEDTDYLYLLYNGWVYEYQYLDSKVVPPTDWDVIKPQGFSCLTLTTCDPIGTSLKRLIIRAELLDIYQ